MARSKRKVRGTPPREADTSTPRKLGFRFPAEWEPHAATWLAWPHEPTDWPGKIAVVPWVFAEVARQLTPGERVRILVRNAVERKRATRVLGDSGVDLKRVDFFLAETDRSWTRDFLPLFVVRSAPAKASEVAAVKWRFTGWGRYPNHRKDEAAGAGVPSELEVPSWNAEAKVNGRRARVVLEGGAIDVDGEGTLLATEECLLDGRFARNRELGKQGIERAFSDYLGVDQVIWVGRGIAGDDTTGHIDDFARFVEPGIVVVSDERNRRDPNYRVLAEARERLEGARDARGRQLEVVQLPMPAPLYYGKQRLPASYANFYIGNEAVLVPTFNDPTDRVALGLLAELFPRRRVVGIHAVDLVLGLGTLHCSTQQEPAGRAAQLSTVRSKRR
jgi:agmatine deiminase